VVEIEVLVREKFVPLKNKASDALAENNPQLFGFLSLFLAGKKYNVGIQVTDHGQIAGDFTIHSEGLKITEVQSGVLNPIIEHPFGVIKPYAIIEREVFERILEDEEGFINEPFASMQKYISDITIKFKR